VATLKTAVDAFPKDASARAAHGDALKAKGDLDGAIAQYAEGVALAPTVENRLALADAYAKKRVSAKARPLYEAVLKEEPSHRVAQLALADLLLAMGDYVAAESLLKPKEGEEPDTAALARLGIIHSRRGRPDLAVPELEAVAAKDPAQLEARAELGFLYLRGGDGAKAKKVLTSVLAVEPRNALGLLYLGHALYQQGNTKDAEKSFRGAAQVDPTFAEPHNALGQLLETAKRLDEAKQEYETALKLQPGHEDAKAALTRMMTASVPTP
jgi:tetratricopeptide (TPR) repeat protein